MDSRVRGNDKTLYLSFSRRLSFPQTRESMIAGIITNFCSVVGWVRRDGETPAVAAAGPSNVAARLPRPVYRQGLPVVGRIGNPPTQQRSMLGEVNKSIYLLIAIPICRPWPAESRKQGPKLQTDVHAGHSQKLAQKGCAADAIQTEICVHSVMLRAAVEWRCIIDKRSGTSA